MLPVKIDNIYMGTRIKTEVIQEYLLEHAAAFKSNLVSSTAARFNVSRQAIHNHVKKLVAEKKLNQVGNTRAASYSVAMRNVLTLVLSMVEAEDEHAIWQNLVLPAMINISPTSIDIWHYTFTEMLNNATNHSEGSELRITVWQSAINYLVIIVDDGIGIFNKMQQGLGLHAKRDAVIELMKGGTTTDRENHTGLGIFYSSQIMDLFAISSEEITFSRHPEDEGFHVTEDAVQSPKIDQGTLVAMRLRNQSKVSLKQFFDRIAPDIETSQPTVGELQLHVVEKNGQKLVSRSQAKMLMARMDVYKTVILDFEGVEFIGQAFADQIFRIFSREHPEVELVTKNVSKEVKRVIQGALVHAGKEKSLRRN